MIKLLINVIARQGMAILFVLFSCLYTHAQETLSNIEDVIETRQIRAHLEFLASDALQGRDTGTDGLKAAAAYISSFFTAHDVDTLMGMNKYYQHIPFTTTIPPSRAEMKIGNQTISFPDDFIVLNGDQRSMKSQGVFTNYGLKEDLESDDIRLKIAVSLCGDGNDRDIGRWIQLAGDKRENAASKGVVGLIELYQNGTVPWRLLKNMARREQLAIDDGQNSQTSIPHIWIGNSDSSLITTLINEEPVIQLNLEGLAKTKSISSNVVGMVPGTDPELQNEFIIFTAHYDHVGIGRADASGDNIYNGARDNAVGTTAVMMLAQYLTQFPMKRSAIFVFFTAEEKGLLGSRYFVENCPIPLNRIKYCLNVDNGGYNDTSIVSVIGLTRTGAESIIRQSCGVLGLEAIEDPAKEQGLFDRSDNVNFAKKGIPAPTFSLGFRAFDAEIFKYYHQPGDEVESLDFNYLEKFVKSYILTAVNLGNSDTSLFWNEGDKYYEVGKELYNPNE